MKNNEWGVTPGTQDNITQEEAPMLSELECELINIFRALPEYEQRVYSRMLFYLAQEMHGKEKQEV